MSNVDSIEAIKPTSWQVWKETQTQFKACAHTKRTTGGVKSSGLKRTNEGRKVHLSKVLIKVPATYLMFSLDSACLFWLLTCCSGNNLADEETTKHYSSSVECSERVKQVVRTYIGRE